MARVDATGGWLVGAKSEYPLRPTDLSYGHWHALQTHDVVQHLGSVNGHVPHESCWPQLFSRVPQTWPALLHASPLSVQPH
jgi:hypothetical protein